MAAVVVAAASGPTPDGPHIPTRGKLLPLGVQFRFQSFDPSTELIGLVVVGCPVQEGDSTDDDGHGDDDEQEDNEGGFGGHHRRLSARYD